jgi:large subunit ribosomal protein L22
MKRIQPRARGTAYTIKRRMAHIRVTLSDMEDNVAAEHEHGDEE